ncbi:class I SAM-dependent methyltransferase [Tolypothrix sp. PCC 7910]|uniref:class I SAM-dependent methyltransferase n=1 Tax=Tolypothrix sp. PCC 7910 TaxID=2099387 RepID=UPI0014277E02|nr:class I SAM-dependent methyltransferase [Tolypothrix sp. PCC 7910]QIR39711.1 class I SAM-dependent methyltransferase [Tolypothrix sp. PCC 7910]
MNNIIGNTISKLPIVKQLSAEIQQLQGKIVNLQSTLNQYQMGWPPGHFYSPIPSIEEVKARAEKIFADIPREILGINLNEEKQIALLNDLAQYYHQQPWSDSKQEGLRFFFDNPNYSYGEAIILYSLIRQIQPQRIIEIGSGYSSAAILDTNELFLDNKINCTFIEPYPQLLSSLLKASDLSRIEIVPTKLQETEINIFSSLAAGDILLIDSTHVSKIDSDVNHILFRILPQLARGVYIHIHDICYPFEYPQAWIYQGRAWNEAYILRAFLQYNSAFEILFFNSFFGYFHSDILKEKMPLCAKNPGTSIWLKKI